MTETHQQHDCDWSQQHVHRQTHLSEVQGEREASGSGSHQRRPQAALVQGWPTNQVL